MNRKESALKYGFLVAFKFIFYYCHYYNYLFFIYSLLVLVNLYLCIPSTKI